MKNIKIYREIVVIIILSLLLSGLRYVFIYVDGVCDSCLCNEPLPLEEECLEKLEDQVFPIIRPIPQCIEDVYSMTKILKPTCVNFNTTKKIFENDLALFIDARDDSSYISGHIQGAINIPFSSLFENFDFNVSDLNENVIAYDDKECFEESFCIGGYNSQAYISSSYPLTVIDTDNSLDLKEKYYIVYCDGVGCEDSKDLSMFFYDNFNITKILFYEGGFPEWKNMEMPIE